MQGNANHSGDMKELQTTLEMHSVNQKRTDFALTSLANTKLYPTIAGWQDLAGFRRGQKWP